MIFTKEQLNSYFNQDVLDFFEIVSQTAEKMNYSAYLVGGGIRDLILNISWDFDLDIVIEGNGISFAKELSRVFNCKIEVHENYGTSILEHSIGNIDIATARTETYDYPAAHPKVSFSSIRADLFRRDFTINALAVSLNKKTFGEVIDLFNGLTDLKNKRLRILHAQSFIDDPNRIFRGLRFTQKLGFTLDIYTKSKAIEVMNSGIFDYFFNDRIKKEAKIIFSNKYNTPDLIKSFHKLHCLSFFNPNLDINYVEKSSLKLFRYINWVNNNIGKLENIWIFYISLFIHNLLEEKYFQKILKNLALTKEEKYFVNLARNFQTASEKYNWENISNYEIYKFWQKYPDPFLIYILSTSNSIEIKKSIHKYCKNLKNIKVELKGNFYISYGIEGRNIGISQEMLLKEKLLGNIKTIEEEKDFLSKLRFSLKEVK